MLKLLLIGMIFLPTASWSVEVYKDGDMSLDLGFWGQAWYQYVGDYDRNADGQWDERNNDFMLRRSYLSVAGTATTNVSFFMHYAADRIGQEGLDNSGLGLGSGLAVRDIWGTYKIIGDDLMVQVGRMYVPFTRNYGTTSTKAMLTTDLDWAQGGLRGGIFYPSKVGRDDGVTIWGNVVDDKLQYRFMVGEGADSQAINPHDNVRFAGRLTLNLLDPEKTWFNSGTRLGKGKFLVFGLGGDYQKDLVLGGEEDDYKAYTIDVFLDMPVGDVALTTEASYIWIDNVVNGIACSDFVSGADGDIASIKTGVLLAGNIQPFGHYEIIMPDMNNSEDTTVYGIGCNYYIKGPANKLTMEWSKVDDDNDISADIFTVQAAFGF
jgi:hypothetical protein